MEFFKLTPISRDKPCFTLIWLHGLGADGSDFEDFQQELFQYSEIDNVNLILPTAPDRKVRTFDKELPAWFDISEDIEETVSQETDVEGMDASVKAVAELIEAEKKASPDVPIVIGGFSQGAVIALLTGFNHPADIQAVVAFSGFVPMMHPRFAEISDVARKLPVFIAHGTLDPVIPINLVTDGVSRLTCLDTQVEFHTYPMVHELCPDEMKDLGDFLKAHLPIAQRDSEE
ncbi:MAG TPA: hypothetical protein DCW60_01370 [Sutterella sp.]|nr:hypothetical protein [Sutterella sp.]